VLVIVIISTSGNSNPNAKNKQVVLCCDLTLEYATYRNSK